MSIQYSFVIRQINSQTVGNIQDAVSHIHFDYVGTDENGRSSFCQGVVPFQLVEHTFQDSEGTKTIPSVLDADNFIPYDDITEEQVLTWIQDNIPTETINTFQEIISAKLNETGDNKNYLPWQIE